MGDKAFLSGNEAVAEGVRLASPHVIAAYPITPQTVVVERLAEMVRTEGLKRNSFMWSPNIRPCLHAWEPPVLGQELLRQLHPRGFCIWLNAFIMPAEGDSPL